MKKIELESFEWEGISITGVAIALIAIIVIAGVGYGIYTIFTPTIGVNVNEKATVSWASNATTATVGDVIVLTAQLSDNKSAVPVYFYCNATQISIQNTNTLGMATLQVSFNSSGYYQFNATAVHP